MLPVGSSYSPSHSRHDDDEEGRVYGDFEEDEEYDDEDDEEDEDEEDLDEEYDDLEDEFDDEDDEPRRGRRSDWDEG